MKNHIGCFINNFLINFLKVMPKKPHLAKIRIEEFKIIENKNKVFQLNKY
jgi:hypothetical protein